MQGNGPSPPHINACQFSLHFLTGQWAGVACALRFQLQDAERARAARAVAPAVTGGIRRCGVHLISAPQCMTCYQCRTRAGLLLARAKLLMCCSPSSIELVAAFDKNSRIRRSAKSHVHRWTSDCCSVRLYVFATDESMLLPRAAMEAQHVDLRGPCCMQLVAGVVAARSGPCCGALKGWRVG